MDQNLSNNSTSTKNNPSPPNTPPHTPNETNPTGEGLETIAKTPEEVLAELNTGNDEEITNENGDGGANEDGGDQGRVPRVFGVALTADGSNMFAVEQSGRNNHVKPFKKRKYNPVRDPPAGKPTCPECNREFASWKAAFGHMRIHPERPHRGFFPPPTFTATAPVAGIHVAEDNDRPVDEGVLTVVRELVIDLNRSIIVPAESSGAGGSSESGRNEETLAPMPENEECRKKNVFDLNELPRNDDDDDEAEEKDI